MSIGPNSTTLRGPPSRTSESYNEEHSGLVGEIKPVFMKTKVANLILISPFIELIYSQYLSLNSEAKFLAVAPYISPRLNKRQSTCPGTLPVTCDNGCCPANYVCIADAHGCCPTDRPNYCEKSDMCCPPDHTCGLNKNGILTCILECSTEQSSCGTASYCKSLKSIS